MESVRFGFSQFTTWPWSFREDLAAYERHRIDAIEICEFKLAHEEYDQLAEVKRRGLVPSSVQMRVHSVFPDSMASRPSDPDDRIQEMKRAIAASAPYLPSGTPFIVITGVAPKGNLREANDRTVEALKTLGECAASHDMTVAFEPLSPVNLHTDTAVWYLDQGLGIVDRANHPAVGICIDSWNVWQTPQLYDVIAQCGSRVRIVQLSDWKTPRSTADRYSLGDGDIPLAAMMRAIRKTGYDGAWVVEILSSLDLEGSLWKADLDEVLRHNTAAFERLWESSAP